MARKGKPAPGSARRSPPIIGWYGITFDAPEDWNIGAVGGDRESGYLRVDDLTSPRLEVKWQRAGARVDVRSILDKYLRDLARRARKQRRPLQTNTEVRILRRRKKKKAALYEFSWKSDRQGCGLIWKCLVCNRIVLAQLSGSARENLIPVAQQVLESMEDHGEDGWDTWCLYGFRFDIPDKFQLEHHRLLTGQLQLEFTRGKSERIAVMRWARAGALLKSGSLEDWTRAALQSQWKTIRFDSQPDAIHEHEAILLRGRPRPITHRLKEKALHTLIRRSPAIITGHGWRCDRQDKIFAVGSVALPAHGFLARDVAESIICHE